MALPVDADDLRGEIEENVKFRDKFLGSEYENKIKRYAGPGYKGDGFEEVDYNNHSYQWISLFLPLMASGNPRSRMTSPRRGLPQLYAKATELAQNRNMHLSDFKGLVEKLAVDRAFKWCVAHTGTEIRPGYRDTPDPPYWPVTNRVSPTRFVADFAHAIDPKEMQFQAIKLTRYKDRILREAKANPLLGWNTKQLMALPEDSFQSRDDNRNRTSTKRREVDFYEIWVPDHVLDEAEDDDGTPFKPTEHEGYHGTIFTVACYGGSDGNIKKAASDYLRAPRPYWGPMSGPFTFGGYLPVPDQTIPLAPLAATEAQARELNDHRRAVAAAIRSYAEFIAIAGGNEDIADKIRDVEDLQVAVLEGIPPGALDQYVKQFKKGGVTKEHLVHMDFLERNLDRSAGMTESQQGQPSGNITATAEAIASQSSGRRMGYMTEKFQQSIVQRIIEKETWYTINDPSYREHLGPEAYGLFFDPVTGEPAEEVAYQGGGDNARLLDEMDIRIEPLSTRYTSEALQAERAAKRTAFMVNVAPVLPAIASYMDVELWMEEEAEQMGDPSFRNLIKYPELQQIAMLQTMGMIQPSQPSGQPRLQSDVRPGLKASEQPTGFSNNARPQTSKYPRASAGDGQSAKVNGSAIK